jgi:bisphosphoglycerate-independent phosphoglycerate mutase (AlkP superfamily)
MTLAMTDGRDTAPRSCLASFEKLAKIAKKKVAELASISWSLLCYGS